MEVLIGVVVILACAVAAQKLFPNEKKLPGGNCRNCPEFRSCGGGRPRCARRSEIRKE